jgi:hypothetical protein
MTIQTPQPVIARHTIPSLRAACGEAIQKFIEEIKKNLLFQKKVVSLQPETVS